MNNVLLTLTPRNAPIQSVKLCSHSKSYFTKSFSIFLVQYSEGVFITIPLESLLQKIQNKDSDQQVNFQKWQTNHNNVSDSAIVNSNLSSLMLSGLHPFPALVNTGSKPFLSVYSISKPQDAGAAQRVKQAASRFFKIAANWIVGSEAEEEEPPIPKAAFEYEIIDEDRNGRQIFASPNGRWFAINDARGRVIVVDSVFGHISKVIKGVRDAQISWKDEFLLVYTPSRGMITCCLIPSGKIIDAVKVDKNGKLFQVYGPENDFGSTFIDSIGNVASLKVNYENENNTNEYKSPLDFHFEFPLFLTNESNSIIKELHSSVSSDNINEEAVLEIIRKVTTPELGASSIRVLLLYPNITEELLYQSIQALKSNVNIDTFEEDSKSFFESSNSSLHKANDIFEYKCFIELANRWDEYKHYETIEVSNLKSIFNDFDLPTKEIPKPKEENLKMFLMTPLKSPNFFFSFIRTENVTVNDIYHSYRIARCTKEEFIMRFVIWFMSASSAQITVAKNALHEFLSTKNVKEECAQVMKQLVMPNGTYNKMTLSYFMENQFNDKD
ncbi:rab3 GTPase-activating protein regulatory subunit [Histomonas meleagridis]|uniref:rab3 GTPase-activating protein regulatory subunit n=1 Tax=Histomonas meleagridis TaxID=135588 RepID=UPI00355A6C2C|nr:rab3 GTPase-activating protein regulatory subunit [Histomonas meleagridis]KAH0804169.1 rab3 GTPase-activating protein regulatory subunit [Histomonas meleagridis]